MGPFNISETFGEIFDNSIGVNPDEAEKIASATAALDHAAKDQGRSFHNVAGEDRYSVDAKVRDMTPPAHSFMPTDTTPKTAEQSLVDDTENVLSPTNPWGI